jgi:hypothetical protein
MSPSRGDLPRAHGKLRPSPLGIGTWAHPLVPEFEHKARDLQVPEFERQARDLQEAPRSTDAAAPSSDQPEASR